MPNKKPNLDDIEVTPIDDYDLLQEKYDAPNWLKRYWFSILLLILFSTFTIIDHTVMKKKIEKIKQENYHERIEHSLDWSRMLCDKQELIIDQLYERRIISMETHKALQGRNELWLRQQMQRKKND